MFKFEIPIWTTMLWVRASVISRNLQWDQWNSDICDDMSEFEVFCSTRSKYGSSIALSNFQLDSNFLSSTYNDIEQISLRWLI